jgi:hypothetical protein
MIIGYDGCCQEVSLGGNAGLLRNNKIVIQPVVGVTNKMLYGDCNVYLIKLQLYHIIIAAL